MGKLRNQKTCTSRTLRATPRVSTTGSQSARSTRASIKTEAKPTKLDAKLIEKYLADEKKIKNLKSENQKIQFLGISKATFQKLTEIIEKMESEEKGTSKSSKASMVSDNSDEYVIDESESESEESDIESVEDDSGSEDEAVYEVEKILDFDPNYEDSGAAYFKVKWFGYSK